MILFKRRMLVIRTLLLCAITLTAGQPVPRKFDPNAKAQQIEGDERKAERDEKFEEKSFPDGFSHDFGKVQSGTPVYHAFRIVNKSDVPLKITQVRVSMASRTLQAWTSKTVLQPDEEGKVQVAVNTRNFVGTKNHTVYVGRAEVALSIGSCSSRICYGLFWRKNCRRNHCIVGPSVRSSQPSTCFCGVSSNASLRSSSVGLPSIAPIASTKPVTPSWLC